MRAICLFVFYIGLASTLPGQTFNATPDPLLVREIQFNQANECYIYFNNPGGDSLQLHWRLIESNLPEEWDADLCDYGLCYTGIPSNGLMSPVYDTIQPYLKLIVQPGEAPGATWIWFRVYEEDNQNNYVDVFYSLHTPGTLSTNTPAEYGVRAYPNPASNYLFLKNEQSMPLTSRLVNASGQMVWQGTIPALSQQQIELREWPAGLYFLQQGSRTQKILVQK